MLGQRGPVRGCIEQHGQQRHTGEATRTGRRATCIAGLLSASGEVTGGFSQCETW